MQVKPGQKIPLTAVIPDRSAGLVVKCEIEKMDGTLLSTVTLTEVHAGVHTDLSFAMPTGVDELNLVYRVFASDGVTPDAGLGSWNELAEVITPLLAGPLKVVVGCEEQPLQHPVEVVQTSDGPLLLSFYDETGNVLDVSAATAIALRIKKADGTTLSKALGSGISLVVGKAHQALVLLLAADYALLPTGELTAQVEVDLGGQKNVVQVPSAIALEASIV